jgi:hypothetical protein
MAFKFTTANSQRLVSANINLSSVYPITMAAWFRAAPISETYITLCGGKDDLNNVLRLGSNPTGGDQTIKNVVAISRTTVVSTASSGPVVGDGTTWNHGAGVFAASNSRRAFANGIGGSTATITRDLAGLDVIVVGAYTTNFSNADIAEVGVWNVVLSDREIASLAKGMTCDKVRPQSLVFYAPLVRNVQDMREGVTITNENTATVSDHPRVYA